MNSIILSLICATLFLSKVGLASDAAETYYLLEQGEKVATTDEGKIWRSRCEEKKDAVSCYDYGVHLAQTLDDEATSIKYYQRGCDLHYKAACFNLGGVLIKKIETRSNGLAALRTSCLSANKTTASNQKKKVLSVACDLIPLIEKNMSLPYDELFPILAKVNPPPHRRYSQNESKPKARGDAKLRNQMVKALDERLMVLKKTDKEQFKKEMDLQKSFNSAVENYCQFYESKCEGSVCTMCVHSCFSAFYSYRTKMANEMQKSKFELGPNIKVLGKAEKYFESFSSGICEMPGAIWKNSLKPDNCEKLVLSDISTKVISSFIESEANEGDVCAQTFD